MEITSAATSPAPLPLIPCAYADCSWVGLSTEYEQHVAKCPCGKDSGVAGEDGNPDWQSAAVRRRRMPDADPQPSLVPLRVADGPIHDRGFGPHPRPRLYEASMARRRRGQPRSNEEADVTLREVHGPSYRVRGSGGDQPVPALSSHYPRTAPAHAAGNPAGLAAEDATVAGLGVHLPLKAPMPRAQAASSGPPIGSPEEAEALAKALRESAEIAEVLAVAKEAEAAEARAVASCAAAQAAAASASAGTGGRASADVAPSFAQESTATLTPLPVRPDSNSGYPPRAAPTAATASAPSPPGLASEMPTSPQAAASPPGAPTTRRRWGARRAAESTRLQLQRAIHRECDVDGDGFLRCEELRNFASETGFDGDDEEWASEYKSLCNGRGVDDTVGFNEAEFAAVVDDGTATGVYCTDEELQAAFARLQAGRKHAAVAATAASSGPRCHAEYVVDVSTIPETVGPVAVLSDELPHPASAPLAISRAERAGGDVSSSEAVGAGSAEEAAPFPSCTPAVGASLMSGLEVGTDLPASSSAGATSTTARGPEEGATTESSEGSGRAAALPQSPSPAEYSDEVRGSAATEAVEETVVPDPQPDQSCAPSDEWSKRLQMVLDVPMLRRSFRPQEPDAEAEPSDVEEDDEDEESEEEEVFPLEADALGDGGERKDGLAEGDYEDEDGYEGGVWAREPWEGYDEAWAAHYTDGAPRPEEAFVHFVPLGEPWPPPVSPPMWSGGGSTLESHQQFILASHLKSRLRDLLRTEEDQRRASECLQSLEAVLGERLPQGHRWRVHAFGSMANGFGSRHGDIDACANVEGLPPGAQVQAQSSVAVLRQLGPLLRGSSFEVKEAILHARIPILRLRYRTEFHDEEVDLSINNPRPLRNTRLLKAYASLSPRVAELGVLIKDWAKCRKVSGAAGGHLSSYAVTLMVIYFLQVGSNSWMPCLQHFAGAGGGDAPSTSNAVWEDPSAAEALAAMAAQSWKLLAGLEALVRGFFKFYAVTFRWGTEVVSVRMGSRLPRHDDAFQSLSGRLAMKLHVEDPFERVRNLSDVFRPGCEDELRHHISETHALLQGVHGKRQSYDGHGPWPAAGLVGPPSPPFGMPPPAPMPWPMPVPGQHMASVAMMQGHMEEVMRTS